MKTIRLILLFIAILGCTIGFFFLTGESEGSGMDPEDSNPIPKYSKDIKRAWERNQDWNEDTFLKYHELATQLDNKQLKDLNTTEAIKITGKKIFAQWSSQDCNHDTIQKYIDGINTIKNKDVNAKNNPTVKTTEDVNTIYQEAYKFVNNKGQFKIYPEELQVPDSGYIYTWTAFDNLNDVKNIKVKKQTIEQDERYRNYLSNINTIKNGLDEIPNKLEESKEQYYDSLATEIRIKFDQISPEERTDKQLDNLVVVRTHFEREWKEIEDLKTLVETFEKDVWNNDVQNNIFLDDDFYY